MARERVLWCNQACDELRVADATGETVATIGSEGETFDANWLNAGVAADGAPLEVGRWTGGSQFEQVDVAPRGTRLHGFVALPRRTVAAPFPGEPSDR